MKSFHWMVQDCGYLGPNAICLRVSLYLVGQ